MCAVSGYPLGIGGSFLPSMYLPLANAANGGNLLIGSTAQEAMVVHRYGARGQTAKEIDDLIQLGANPSKYLLQRDRLMSAHGQGSTTMRRAQQLWVKTGQPAFEVSPDYIAKLRQDYGTGVERFETGNAQLAARVNDWIATASDNMLQNIVDPSQYDAETRMVHAALALLIAKWKNPFSEKQTEENGEFTTLSGARVSTPIMFQAKEQYAVGTDGGSNAPVYQAIKLPFDDDRTEFIIIMPQPEYSQQHLSFSALEEKLFGPQQMLATVVEQLDKSFLHELPIKVPRLEIATKFQMQKLGMFKGMSAFIPGAADFSGIHPSHANGDIFIGNMLHAAKLMLDEKGIKMADVTVSDTRGGAFYATQPFIFLVRDKETGVVLGLGRVTDPTIKGFQTIDLDAKNSSAQNNTGGSEEDQNPFAIPSDLLDPSDQPAGDGWRSLARSGRTRGDGY